MSFCSRHLCVVFVACGGSPTAPAPAPAPPPPTTLATPSGAVLNELGGCSTLRALNAGMGIPLTSCAFTGTLQNTGAGCAANVKGTVTAYADSAGTQQTGSAGIVVPATQSIRAGAPRRDSC